MIETNDSSVTVMCDPCGSLFECDDIAVGRKRWVEEGWKCVESHNRTRHLCPDCAVEHMPLKKIQEELRKFFHRSSAFRRQALWRRLDYLLGFRNDGLDLESIQMVLSRACGS